MSISRRPLTLGSLVCAVAVAALAFAAAGCADTPDEPPAGDAEAAPDLPAPDVAEPEPDPPSEDGLAEHCASAIGAPRVEEVAEGLFVAIGYDLANTILLVTPAGNVVIDVSSSPIRATQVRDALHEVAPGPTLAIIYTHSHADHIGGASVWAEEGTQIWATDAFLPHLIKQYGQFREAETRRAQLQFGQDVSLEELPCSALGKRIDIDASLETGVLSPTHTFSGEQTLEFGGVTVELVEAHGETHDQLFVYVPSLEALMPGDNYYETFPNLYTIRGTSPRPVDQWIASLDAMRRRDAELLVPSHTHPVIGRAAVREVLTDYRDGIQWVRDEVVRGANALESIESMAERIALPEHLESKPWLQPLYGQVDWSVRAIYTNALGWFDARPDQLYPPKTLAAREIALMGGAEAVLEAAGTAVAEGDPRWAAHLLGKLRDSGAADASVLTPRLAEAYRAVAAQTDNSNGRGYLLEAALLLTEGDKPTAVPVLKEAFVDAIPIEVFFDVLPGRLKVDSAREVHESARFEFTDTTDVFTVTVRFGVAEIVRGEPLPDTPAAIAVFTTDTGTWRRLALGLKDQIAAVGDGTLVLSDLVAAVTFMDRFNRGL
ncbi:MAG: alkyl sulfatase BDS1-like metallo-beta-lactamase superfamily hydrolase [Myxococcota bacterium]|jgi:alkyl sulfatase BDS1-like metallo-beta-lactamase superfamily hydrolase